MPDLAAHLPGLALTLGVFITGAASPGPATLTITATALAHGRRAALQFAFGVIAGSTVWGILAASGLAAMLILSANVLTAVKLAGAAYLGWLAWKSLRNAASRADPDMVAPAGRSGMRQFAGGLMLHLTNPKAPLVWIATLSIGLEAGAPPALAAITLALCQLASIAIFSGYALAFSTETAARAYRALRRPFHAAMAVLFGAAAWRMASARL